MVSGPPTEPGERQHLSRALLRITLQMTSSLELDEVLRTLVEGMLEELGALSTQIWLAAGEGEAATLELRAVAGLARTLEEEERRALAGFRVSEIASRAEALVTDQLTGAVPASLPDGQSPRAFVGCPLVFRGKVLGVLSSFVRQPLAQESVELLDLFARQAAIAIGNARLHEEVLRLKRRYEAESLYLQEEMDGEHNCGDIVGTSAVIRTLRARIEQVAPTDATVLIQGETGTGKELAALAVHRRSRRRTRPLVKVNCGALPANLVESELFGHQRGAFTGATESRVGRFELADGGTLFLDEVGELPADAQVKLLRVLQEGELERVGSSRTVKVDVRVLAATHRDLAREVEAGRFRADLFYRLNVFPLEVPPLRERRKDIPAIASCLLGRLSQSLGKTVSGLTTGSTAALSAYSWPGNVRELLNVLERAAILSPGPVIDVTAALPQGKERALGSQNLEGGTLLTLREAERVHIERVLQATDWVIEGPEGAAVILGLAPSTLRSRLQRLGLHRPGG